MRLVVVESPAKAKTINKYLGGEYMVIASYGHIRDLLSKNGSVQPDNDFSMVWELSDRGKKFIGDASKYLKSCDELLLATDPDREGEAISWHIKEVLEENNVLKVPYKRIVFHEITKKAIKAAIDSPRDIDERLVDSYLARRALDYLVGFTLSPILWRKLPGSRSAGRVQSVALRIIVERESEIEAFKTEEYWSIDAKFATNDKKIFSAKLTYFDGEKLEKFSITNEEKATSIKDIILSQKFIVKSVDKKSVKRNPAPAFITSTLQQEASRKLGFSAKKTMQLAQKLYEGVDVGGETKALITYMRTDSVHLSEESVQKVRSLISKKYGDKFVPQTPRVYKTKVKNAQEAHEAIRPVDADVTPDSINGKIDDSMAKLYDLIWKRAVASQMSSAEFDQVQVDISNIASGKFSEDKNIFRATGSTLTFDGFLKVYSEGKDESNQQEEENESFLPVLKELENLSLMNLDANQHFTLPPPRFSEASLVKKLEELGIGRPSTYATILQVLQDRKYVKLEKRCFIPEVRGRLVTSFLMIFFYKYLEYGFTADLEQSLDNVSNGDSTRLSLLEDFWNAFYNDVDQTKEVKISDVIDKLNESLKTILFPIDDNGNIHRLCPECKQGELSLKMGRYGAFVGCSRYPDCNYVRKLDIDPSVEENALHDHSEYPKIIGIDPKDQSEITLRKGPYGLYVQKNIKVVESPKTEQKNVKSKAKKSKKDTVVRSSIPKFIEVEKLDLNTAVWLLSLPIVLGIHENEEVKIGIGRFGAYVLFKGKYASIKDQSRMLTLTLDDALKLITEKEKSATIRTFKKKI